MGLGVRDPCHLHVQLRAFVRRRGHTLREGEAQGSPFKRLLQVLVATFKKRKESVPEDVGLLYQNKDHDVADDDPVLDGLLVLADTYGTFDSGCSRRSRH